MPVDLRYFSAFCAMKRGSREYCSLVMGSTMLQISDSVGAFMKGSITAVSGSGTTSMSLAWMGIQPRMDEPSNPRPSSKTDSVSSEMGTLKCCQSPMKSMNFISTMTACLSFASPMTSLPFGILCCPLLWEIRLELQRRLAPLAGADPHYFVHRGDEDLAVSDAPRLGGPFDRFQNLWHHLVRKHELDLHFWQEVDHVLGASVELGVSFLTPEPLHFGHREPEDSHVRERLLHLVELEGLDDGLDLLHCRRLLGRAQDTCEGGLWEADSPSDRCYSGERGICGGTPRVDRPASPKRTWPIPLRCAASGRPGAAVPPRHLPRRSARTGPRGRERPVGGADGRPRSLLPALGAPPGGAARQRVRSAAPARRIRSPRGEADVVQRSLERQIRECAQGLPRGARAALRAGRRAGGELADGGAARPRAGGYSQRAAPQGPVGGKRARAAGADRVPDPAGVPVSLARGPGNAEGPAHQRTGGACAPRRRGGRTAGGIATRDAGGGGPRISLRRGVPGRRGGAALARRPPPAL